MNINDRDIPSVPGTKRTYSPEEAGHGKSRRPVSRYRRRRHKAPNPGVIILLLVFAIIICSCLYIIISGKNNPGDSTGQGLSNTDATVQTTPVTESPKEITVTVTDAEMHMGNLILVNYAYPYTFAPSEINEVTTVLDNKNDCYLARDNKTCLRLPVIKVFNKLMEDFYSATGCATMQVNSAYRSYDEQVSLYDDYKKQYGEEYAKSYVANPGYSEHHTGLALDLNVFVKGEGVYYVESYPACEWFRAHCDEYGFVLRYPEDKVYITAINHESWHYRYVGVPHAQIMTEQKLCLEEYIDYLKTYTYDGNILYFNETVGQITKKDSFSKGSIIYYVPSAGSETKITVPNVGAYEISGNNVDGYIVTVTK